MKKNNHFQVSVETLNKLITTFSDSEEYGGFIHKLDVLVEEISYLQHLSHRQEDHNGLCIINAQSLLSIALFCRENMDVIHELVRRVEIETLPEGEYPDAF